MANSIDNFKSNIRLQVQKSSIFKSANEWYSQLAARDQLIVKALSVVMLLAIVFAWVWQPVVTGKTKAENKFNTEMSFHKKMKENAFLFSSGSIGESAGGASILTIVNTTAKVKNIQLKRFEPDGKTGLRIWLDQVNFNAVIDWLELLETTRGIKVEQISIDKVNSGIVNVRAVLQL
ncbi:MAG: general secretion pathway protein M [Oceanicoccus sp.]|jgi:general secretion pathway protein M